MGLGRGEMQRQPSRRRSEGVMGARNGEGEEGGAVHVCAIEVIARKVFAVEGVCWS
jgi:hypothetical protein